MKVLANDGISQSGIDALEKGGYEVITTTVAQEQLINYINEKDITVLLVRSATTVRKDLIDACSGLKIIGRGGVGMDNIDVEYAKEQGRSVINTPAASSHSVAELVFGHLYGLARYLHNSNRDMPLEGDSNFKGLKKAYAKGTELKGKTLGVLGFGRIGQATAKVALGAGMKVVAFDKFPDFEFATKIGFNYCNDINDLFSQSDIISLNLSLTKETFKLISTIEINLFKDSLLFLIFISTIFLNNSS